MRKIETVVRTHESEQVTAAKCDLCGRVHPNPANVDNWATSWNLDEIHISRRHGESFPEYARGTVDTFDVCPECWETKLVPFFALHAAEPTIKPYDF